MRNFVDASNYIMLTPAENIAAEVMTLMEYFKKMSYRLQEPINLGHDAIADIIVAVYGPFDFNFFQRDDNESHLTRQKIFDMLRYIDNGFRTDWIDKLIAWADCEIPNNAKKYKLDSYSYNVNVERKAFYNMIRILLECKKSDEILAYYNTMVDIKRKAEAEGRTLIW